MSKKDKTQKVVADFSAIPPFTPYIDKELLKKYGSLDFLKMRTDFYGIKNPAVKRGKGRQKKSG